LSGFAFASTSDQLFELERNFADLSAEERFKERQRLAKPLFAEFFSNAQGNVRRWRTAFEETRKEIAAKIAARVTCVG